MKKIVLIIFLSFVAVSCNLFDTRNAEEPDKGKSSFIPPVRAEDVIKNLKNSFIDKNVQNYIACFVDTLFANKKFSFSASSEAIALYQVFLQGWGLNEEKRYFNSVINKVPADFPITLTFSDENYSNLSGDSLIYTASYNLNLPISNADPTPANYAGILQFNMLRDMRSEWVIYYWKDTRGESLPGWSELKGIFY
ncbi:MAG: hypothetical protein B6D44_07715 [Ignavibacteriales bacterium UTCHB2]|jgi:hypothetical protein|nr:MAG: hypothetical protein BWY38_02717 [Ignavibacteria bacterium ADurb.Bin266]OQY73247.1 MAG: hypothetical protein B6D44_07715 [Ignavibacteriales bacterium UTCHB2]HQI42450.1 hypothetical protein [Ignavibacteriaceae bacterium]